MTDPLATAWLAAAEEPGIVSALESIYTSIAREVERRGPACWASGRCCGFEKAGHRLYVTGLEAAYTVSRLPRRPAPGSLPQLGDRAAPLTPGSLAGAGAGGTCPFLAGHLCGAHAMRPLGCRVYFCDRSAQEWQRDLSERMLAMVRTIHDGHRIEYRYGEWRSMLARFVG
jgi:Fe-S-cluster containining protein